MIRFCDFKLTGAPPRLSWVVRRPEGAPMADAALLRLWAAVCRDFDRAQALLPSPPAEAEGSVGRLEPVMHLTGVVGVK